MGEWRTCEICDKKMSEGYIISDGMEYYCSDDCLHGVYTEDEYLEMYDKDYAFWTIFED